MGATIVGCMLTALEMLPTIIFIIPTALEMLPTIVFVIPTAFKVLPTIVDSLLKTVNGMLCWCIH